MFIIIFRPMHAYFIRINILEKYLIYIVLKKSYNQTYMNNKSPTDPCNDPRMCKNITNGVARNCRSEYDPSIKVDINPNSKALWQKIFQRRLVCGCASGYAWDKNKRNCVDGQSTIHPFLSFL